MPDEVKVETTISGYVFDFAHEHIKIAVNQLRRESHILKGEIKFYLLGKVKKESLAFEHNFSSLSAEKTLIKNLAEKYTDWGEIDIWHEVIDKVTLLTQELYKTGEPSYVIEPTTSGIIPPGYYIEPVIMKGVPNVIYGDKGTNKTSLAIALLGLLANGVNDSDIGLTASETATGALIDWENDKDKTDYTVSRMVNAGTIPYFPLHYLRCTSPLVDEIERVGNFIDQHKPKIIVIDSLGRAAGTEAYDSGGKRAADRFFEAYDKLKVTGLLIGQNPKNEDRKSTIYGSIYYSYYSRNIFRLAKSREQPLSKDELSVGLVHDYSNYSGLYDPIGLRFIYTDSTIKIEHEEANMSQFMDRVNLTQNLLEYLKSGAKPVKAISDELNLSDKRVRTLLSQQKKQKRVTNLGSGLWALASDRKE